MKWLLLFSVLTIAFIEGRCYKCFDKNDLAKCFTTSQEDLPHGTLRFGFTCETYNAIQPCIEDLISEKCPTTAPHVIGNMKTRFCKVQKKSLKKREILFESGKYGVLSFVPSRKRVTRDIGGVGSKLPHIEKKVKDLCDNDEKLIKSIDSMKICLRLKPMFQTPKDEFIQQIDKCSNETRIELKRCLPKKLQYFPDFFFSLVESVVKLVYDDFGEIARGISPCMPKLKEQKSEDAYEDCINRAGEDFQDNMIESKQTFCEGFLKTSKCFIKQLDETCTTNKDLEKFKKDYMAAMERPCS